VTTVTVTGHVTIDGATYSPTATYTATPTTPATVWGMGGSVNVGDYVNRQAVDLHARAFYSYGTGATWGQCSQIPATHDIFFQCLQTTASTAAAALATFPASRAGKVYLHAKNEPEDNMAAATYKQQAAVLYAAADAAGLPYLVKSAELNAYHLGAGDIDESTYVPAGVQHILWSVYGIPGVTNGHSLPKKPGDYLPNAIASFMATNLPGIPWSCAAGGLAIDPTVAVTDPQSSAARLAWCDQWANALTQAGARHICWYDTSTSSSKGDYLIADDPALRSWWIDPGHAGSQ
jgi:hypothetical protein